MSDYRILVLDDAKAVHERVRKAFVGTDIKVNVTDSWVDTKVAVFSNEPPDLLVLDLQMPTIDGRAVGRAIKRRLPIPIVVFSSEDPSRLSRALEEIGAEAALSKSASDRELVDTVTRLLRNGNALGSVGRECI